MFFNFLNFCSSGFSRRAFFFRGCVCVLLFVLPSSAQVLRSRLPDTQDLFVGEVPPRLGVRVDVAKHRQRFPRSIVKMAGQTNRDRHHRQ